jgi:hypothetical protein
MTIQPMTDLDERLAGISNKPTSGLKVLNNNTDIPVEPPQDPLGIHNNIVINRPKDRPDFEEIKTNLLDVELRASLDTPKEHMVYRHSLVKPRAINPWHDQ